MTAATPALLALLLSLSPAAVGCGGAVSPAEGALRSPTPEALLSRSHGPAVLDTIVQVDGRGLHLLVRAQEGATVAVVLESGGGADAGAWEPLMEAIAAATGATVVAYDRAGFGASDLGPPDLTPARQVEDLRKALGALAVPRRVVLAGHSYGALMALLHAAVAGEDVLGLVLVDPMNPGFVAATGDFIYSTVPEIAAPANDPERAIVRIKATFDDLLLAVAEVEPGLAVPVVVVTAGEGWWGRPETDAAWRRSHEALSAAPGRRLVVAEGSDHDILAERPELVVEAVADVLSMADDPP